MVCEFALSMMKTNKSHDFDTRINDRSTELFPLPVNLHLIPKIRPALLATLTDDVATLIAAKNVETS